MEFNDKYSPTTINTDPKQRIVISDDAFAIGEMLQAFINELRWQAGKSRERS